MHPWLTFSSIGTLLVSTVLTCEANPVLIVIMHSIVVKVDGDTHDQEGSLALLEEEHALGPILLWTDIPHVMRGVNFEPRLIKHEVQGWEIT